MGVADLIISGALKKKKKEENTYNVKDGTYTAEAVKSTNKKVKDTVDTFNNVSDRIKSNTTMSFDDDNKTYKTKSTITDEKKQNKTKKENAKKTFDFSADDESVIKPSLKGEDLTKTDKKNIYNQYKTLSDKQDKLVDKQRGKNSKKVLEEYSQLDKERKEKWKKPSITLDEALDKNSVYTKNYGKEELSNAVSKKDKDKLSDLTNTQKYTTYLKNAAYEDTKESTALDKVFGPLAQAGGLVTGLTKILPSTRYKDENGNYIYLPNKLDLYTQRVQNDYDTKFGKFYGDVAGGASKIAASELVNLAAPGVGSGLYYGSMFGENIADANNKQVNLNGKNDGARTLINAGIKTGLEFLTGKFLGSATKGLTGGTASELEKGISNKVYNKLSKLGIEDSTLKTFASNLTGKVGSEGTEEFSQNYLENMTDIITLGSDGKHTNILKMLSDPDVLSDAIYAGLVGGATGGLFGAVSGDATNVDIRINKLNLFKSALQEDVNNTTDVAKKEKLQGIINNIDKNLQTPFSIEENALQGYQDELINQNLNVQQPINQMQPQTLTQTPLNQINQGISEQNVQTPFQEQTPQIMPLNQVNQELQETRQQDVADSVRAMNLEQEPEFTQKQGNYVYKKSDNSKIDNLRKDAATYLKEGEQTTNFVNTLEKLVKDKDIEIRFDTKLGNNVNGTYKDGVITINPNSNRAGEFVAIHELTHAIGTKPMIDMIENYRKSNAEFNNAVERLLSTYKTTEINEEALGDIAGQLFGNQEFINNLSMENPSLFKKIYNEIKYLWHQFTGYKNQDQFIEDLRNKWESAYRNSKAKQTSKTGYSINEAKSLLTNKKGYDLGTYQDGLSKTDKSYKYNKVYTYDIANGGKGDNVQVSVTKNGYVWNNALLSDNVKGKGEGTKIALDLNQQSLEETGKPLRSLPEYNVVGIKNHTEDGKGLWDSLVRKGYAIKNADNTYTMLENAVPQNEDIRYSTEETNDNDNVKYSIDESSGKLQENGKDVTLETSKTGNTGTLMAIHNLNEDKLKGILELGGFPVPSIAITNPSKINHEGYGEISVLFNKNTIDPSNKTNEVYSRDAWSPRFPTINREILQDNISKISKNIGINESSLQYLAEEYNKIEDLAYRLSRDSDVVEKYLDDNNIKYTNEDNLRKLAEKNGIVEYLNNQLKDIYGKKGIRNDKEIYTPSGNKRSFNQLHDEYNLENLVKNLTKKKTVGGEESFASGTGVGTIEAKLSKKFNSIENIKKYENEIENISYDDKQKFKDAIYDDMAKLNEFRKYKSEYSFYDNSGYALNDFAEYKEQNLSNLKKALEKNEIDSTKIPESLLNKTIKDINALKNLPTDYFEAKPQRAVGLDEVQQIVIPNNIDAEFKKQLQDAGLSYAEYDPNIENDRQRVINQFDDLKFSKENQTWREYLEKEFPSQGTRTDLGEITGRKKPKQENKTTQEEKPQEQPKKVVKQNYLTKAEQEELETLKELDNKGFLEEADKDYKRLQELEKKQQGIVKKFPELKKENTFDDIKGIYGKYKNNEISKSNKEILNKAKSFIEPNSQGRRTIEQWKSIAEFIGSNADIKNSQDLQRLAIETWHEQKPNSKEQLNRQGKKYVPFAVQDWVNAVYKGAGVGTDVKMSIEEATDSNGNKVELKPTKNNTYEQVNVKPKKTDVIPDMSNKVLNIGNEKVSNFYSNITEKSKFITEENREALKDNTNLQYYDAITNKDTLESAMDKLDKNAEQQVGDFFAKKDFNAEDVATGWILVKRYQDAGNYEAMSNVIEKMREQGTKAGQAVQAYGILQRLTPEGMEYYSQKQLDKAFNEYSKNKSKKQIEKYAKDFTLTAEEHQFIKDTMKKVEKMKDEEAKKVEIAKIVSMLSDKMPPERGQRLKAWMRISMLGNPKTQVRNVAGNAIIQPVNWVGDIFAATADKIMAKQTGKRTIGTTDFGALTRGSKQGLKDAIRDAKTGVDTRDINLDRFEENIGSKPFYEGHNSKLLNTAAKALNKTNKILGNIMSGGDRIFYQGIYENSLANQMKLNNVTKPTQEMKNIAEQEALSRTWNDSNEYTKAVLQIRNAMNKLNVKGYGLGDVLVPFAKTPANLTKAIVDYSPVGLTRSILQDGKNYKNSLENGQYSPELQHKFAESLGKGMAGSLLYVAAAALAKAGITSGASDDDKDVANFMRNTLGIQPYSVKIGDKSFTYDWAQPIAAPFAIMADAKRISEKENQELGDIITTATSSASNILLEQSFLSSIQDVFNSYEGPSAAIKQQIQDLPARATPTFFKQIADLIDPTSRQTFVKGNEKETLKNKVQVKIPGASKELVSQRDTLGREIQKYGGDEDKLKYAFNVFLNPANTNKGKTSQAAEEIYSIYKATGDKTIMPRQVGYSENIGGSIRNLTAKERNELQKLSGQKIEENVKALTQSSKYNSMSNEDKAAVINGIVNYSYAKAKSDLFDTNISTMYKTAAKKEEQGIPLYDYYINRVSKRR